MLQWEATVRITPTQALAHEFFRLLKAATNAPSTALPPIPSLPPSPLPLPSSLTGSTTDTCTTAAATVATAAAVAFAVAATAAAAAVVTQPNGFREFVLIPPPASQTPVHNPSLAR